MSERTIIYCPTCSWEIEAATCDGKCPRCEREGVRYVTWIVPWRASLREAAEIDARHFIAFDRRRRFAA
jgi:hypothetical protein